MFIFGKKRESLRIKKVQAARAVFMDGNGTEEIEIRLRTDDGERLDLQLPYRLAPRLVQELMIAHDAISPPMRLGQWNSQQQGMEI